MNYTINLAPTEQALNQLLVSRAILPHTAARARTRIAKRIVAKERALQMAEAIDRRREKDTAFAAWLTKLGAAQATPKTLSALRQLFDAGAA